MTRSASARQPALVPLAAQIVDIEDRDGPRAAYAALQTRLVALKREGAAVPTHLQRLEARLLSECCCAMSQGR